MPPLVNQLRERSFHFYPVHHLFGLVRSAERAETAIRDLFDAGFRRDHIRTWLGDRGAEVLDADGTSHGMAARLWRTAQEITGEQQIVERYAEEILAGRVCVGVKCETSEEARKARAVLERDGAYFLNYYGLGTVETLTP